MVSFSGPEQKAHSNGVRQQIFPKFSDNLVATSLQITLEDDKLVHTRERELKFLNI